MTKSRIQCEGNLSAVMHYAAYLRHPRSAHKPIYGRISNSIISLRNGRVPTGLVVDDNHGREFEGIVTVPRLCQELLVGALRGRLTLPPAANLAGRWYADLGARATRPRGVLRA